MFCVLYTERPQIVEGPKDVLVQENADVTFQCEATGHPQPTIIWKKVDGQMPQGRSARDAFFCAYNSPVLILSKFSFIGPIPWGHSGPLCHALSLSLSALSWTSMRRRRATVPLATSDEWA